MGDNEKAVLTTILYSDIFDFPLTLSEIAYWSSVSLTQSTIKKITSSLSADITCKKGYIFMKEREYLIDKRISSEISSVNKKIFAKKYIDYLSKIPTILFIGISGAVAANNADDSDDIDICIITKRHSLWVSRLCILLILEFHGVRRKFSQNKEKNTICVNMLFTEEELAFPPNRQDMYTAREILQLIPIFNANHIYTRFLGANTWVNYFYPSAYVKKKKDEKLPQDVTKKLRLFVIFLRLERVGYLLQRWYMSSHISSEIVEQNKAFFHPYDYRLRTLEQLEIKLRKYNIEAKFHLTGY